MRVIYVCAHPHACVNPINNGATLHNFHPSMLSPFCVAYPRFYRYATGTEITEHSVLIHEFYSSETEKPIHMVVDTTCSDATHMNMLCVTSEAMGVPDGTAGTLFTPVECEVLLHKPERVACECRTGFALFGRIIDTACRHRCCYYCSARPAHASSCSDDRTVSAQG